MDTRSKTELILSLTKILEEKIEPINQKLEKLDSIEKSIEEANEDRRNIAEFKVKLGHLTEELESTKQQLSEVQLENKNLRESMLKQELYSRKNNVKFFWFQSCKSSIIRRSSARHAE